MATATTATMRRTVSSFGPLQIAITILVAATALVHLFMGVNMTMGVLSPTARAAAGTGGVIMGAILAVLFLCNFGGYVVLNAALYLPVLRRFQRITRALLIGFTAVTFVAYFAIDQGQALTNHIGLADKAVEAALIALLVIDGRRARA